MLERLHIKNIALISELETALSGGLNVLSGETGAGKSIIVDSINFILGGRADKSMLRHGETSGFVEAVFDLSGSGAAKSALCELTGEEEDTAVISRSLTAEGKSDIRLNGRTVTLGMLKKLTALLVDIHGQHEHQSLLKVSTHIHILDYFLDEKAAGVKDALTAEFKSWRALGKELAAFGKDDDDRERTLDILAYQIKEIEDADIKDGEEEELRGILQVIANQERITAALATASGLLSGGGDGGEDGLSAVDMVAKAAAALDSVSGFSADYAECARTLEGVLSDLEDAARSVRSVFDEPEYGERDADRLTERLERIKTVKRKYGGDLAAVRAFLADARERYDNLSGGAERIEKLKAERAHTEKKILAACKELHGLRAAAAERFERLVTAELADVGMKNAVFKADLGAREADAGMEGATENGYDSVEFLLSANVGEPVKPLSKIISGGEMSRFMLAIKNITAEAESVPTMIFDEIDSGISGKMGQVVACKMAKIAKGRQVVCVTHLPQIAAMADTNFLIQKNVEDGKTLTRLIPLDPAGKRAEVGRLTGGGGISDFTESQAHDMIVWSDNFKESI